MFGEIATVLALGIWLYLLIGRGGFWLACVRDDRMTAAPEPEFWPPVAAVIPARDEADSIGECMSSLLAQDYPGLLHLIVVDDGSGDDTAAVARRAAAVAGAAERLTVVSGRPLPGGWTGKLWAVKQGMEQAAQLWPRPSYVLLTDADIAYQPGVLRALVAGAEARGLVLASLMAKLRCRSLVEQAFIPAFVFFFQMLYPFRWVNRRNNAIAAAAGGCMLVRADVLRQAGGIDSIRGALIDDCALARRLKPYGPIHLALTQRVHSLRPYPRLADVGSMVSRTAYTELRHSPLALAGATAAMALTFLAGPLFALFGAGEPQIIGGAVWGLMALAYRPMLRFYRVSSLWGPALPAIAFAYLVWTLDSALQYARGKGGAWKGRIQANQSGVQ
jgi:hopene-associated glycosyltransferase HpnB